MSYNVQDNNINNNNELPQEPMILVTYYLSYI